MFGVKETDNGGPKGVVDEQTASSSPSWFLRGNWVIVQTVCQKGPGQTAVWIWELLAVRHQCSTVQPKQEVYAHVRAKKGHVLSQRFAKNMKTEKNGSQGSDIQKVQCTKAALHRETSRKWFVFWSPAVCSLFHVFSRRAALQDGREEKSRVLAWRVARTWPKQEWGVKRPKLTF